MKTLKVNILVSYDNVQQEKFDWNVNLTPLQNPFDKDKLRERFWSQIIPLIKGDKSELVKLSARFYDDSIFYKSKKFLYLFKNNFKLWFQPDQRDDFENLLCEKFNLSSNTIPYSQKYSVSDDVWFPINDIADFTMTCRVTRSQSEKKFTDEIAMEGWNEFSSTQNPRDYNPNLSKEELFKEMMLKFLRSKSTPILESTTH